MRGKTTKRYLKEIVVVVQARCLGLKCVGFSRFFLEYVYNRELVWSFW